jgi:hypothetical protein
MAEIKSIVPPRTRFPGSEGSKSQIAVVDWIELMCVTTDMKSTMARFITWARHLQSELDGIIGYA